MTRQEQEAQLERMQEKVDNFPSIKLLRRDSARGYGLEDLCQPCPNCGTMCEPDEECPICEREEK